MPDGRVTSVELEHGSGSPWLDLALEGLFRGAKLPPLPKSAGDQPVPFHFTMHYILIR
jgi:outer membrane biosynthesis protein TonB